MSVLHSAHICSALHIILGFQTNKPAPTVHDHLALLYGKVHNQKQNFDSFVGPGSDGESAGAEPQEDDGVSVGGEKLEIASSQQRLPGDENLSLGSRTS